MSKALFYTLSKFQQFQLNFFQPKVALINPVVATKQTTNYPFVTLIRFISMIGIVWAHVMLVKGDKTEREFFDTIGHVEIYIAFMQIFKFGVICFFMISGFLLGDKINSESLSQYYKKRLQSTLKPFLLVLLLFIGIVIFRVFIIKHDIEKDHSSILKIIRYSIFKSHLWYLPNYLLTLAVILTFSKFLNSKIFGIILFTVTLLYTVFTVYTVQYQLPHSSALFAYVFYLWLGIYIRKNNSIIQKIKKIKLIPFTIILITVFSLSCLESYKMYQNYLGYYNILRIFNQLYSITMFAFLIRVCNSNPNFGMLNPRRETFGIYLYHGIFAEFGLPKLINIINTNKILDLNLNSVYSAMGYHVLFFSLIYITTTILVKVMLKYNLGYLQNKNSIST